MYSKLNSELHFSDCSLLRGRKHKSREKLNTPTESHYTSPSCSRRLRRCENFQDCEQFGPYFFPREHFNSKCQLQDWGNLYCLHHQEVPFSDQKFPNTHIVYHSSVMTQTPSEIFSNRLNSGLDETILSFENKKLGDIIPARPKKNFKRKNVYGWKKALRTVKYDALQKFEAKLPTTIEGNSTQRATVIEHCPEIPKLINDGKGDGNEEVTKTENTPKVLTPADVAQKIEITNQPATPRNNPESNKWRIKTPSDKRSAHSTEKVSLWLNNDGISKQRNERKRSQSDERKPHKERLPSISQRSSKGNLTQMHQCLQSYIDYLLLKNDKTETKAQSISSTNASVAQIDTDTLITVLDNPLHRLASDFTLTMTRSLTEAAKNADAGSVLDPIARMLHLRNKQCEKVSEKLKELFRIIRILDKVSGLSKEKL